MCILWIRGEAEANLYTKMLLLVNVDFMLTRHSIYKLDDFRRIFDIHEVDYTRPLTCTLFSESCRTCEQKNNKTASVVWASLNLLFYMLDGFL